MTDVISIIRRSFGNFKYPILFVVCIAIGLILDKGKRKYLFIPSILVCVAVLNPIIKQIVDSSDSGGVYWRTLWIIPMVVTCASVPAMLIEKCKKSQETAAIVILAISVYIFIGSFVYQSTNTTFRNSSNAEKLPNNVVEIGQELLDCDNYPRVVSDDNISVYLRQYDGHFQTPYSREVVYGNPTKVGRDFFSDLREKRFDELATKMVNYDYEYLITDLKENGQDLTSSGFELIYTFDGYGVYQVHGIKSEVREYNDKGQVTSITTVDKYGKPDNAGNWYATICFDYDSLGRVTYEFHRDEKGNGTEDATGKAGYIKILDYYGNVIKETLLDADEKPAVIGYATRVCEYNIKNQKIKESYYNEAEEPMIHSVLSYASKTISYNEQGDIIAERYYGLNNELVNSNAGRAGYDRVFDKKHRIVLERYIGTDGKPLIMGKGYAQFVREYNSEGLIAKELYYDSDNNLVITEDGYAGIEFGYDEFGNNIYKRYYDDEGNVMDLLSPDKHIEE